MYVACGGGGGQRLCRGCRRIAQQHLREAEEISIKVKTTTADTIRQRPMVVLVLIGVVADRR